MAADSDVGSAMHVELELRGEVYNLMRLAAVPGGPLVACADSESWVQLWDVARGATHDERRQVGETAVWDMAVVTIGGRPALAVCGPRAVSVWDLATFGTADVPLREYEVSWAMGMAAIPATDSSAELLVTAEKDIIRIVDPATGEQRSAIQFPETPEGGVGNRVYKPTGVRFADGTAGFAVDNGGRLEVWRLDADGKAQRSRVRAVPALSRRDDTPSWHGRAVLAGSRGGTGYRDMGPGRRRAGGPRRTRYPGGRARGSPAGRPDAASPRVAG
ncbi:hypothetical protein DL990_28940 [Amycolatopsis sp. WAC 01416]|nr:hypothetical protein DL990_28940 [Amycolatopsis sp. WAC 01416]